MTPLEIVGLATCLWVGFFVARVIYQTFVYKCDLQQFQTPRKNGWALVTGCTSGIGEGFAHVLASRGFNLLLVSRSETKLRALAAALKASYPSVQTTYVISDAADPAPAHIDDVVAAAAKVPLTMLINNVGVSSEVWTRFEQDSAREVEAMIAVNVRYTTLLTQQLLPLLRQAPRAAIVNLSSQSATIHPPYLAVYGATKAYNLALSNALRDELASDCNIEVLALTPGFVVTEMTRIGRTSLEVCDAATCATAGLNAIGLRSHAGYWYHHLFLKAVHLLPADVRQLVALRKMKKMARDMKTTAKSNSNH